MAEKTAKEKGLSVTQSSAQGLQRVQAPPLPSEVEEIARATGQTFEVFLKLEPGQFVSGTFEGSEEAPLANGTIVQYHSIRLNDTVCARLLGAYETNRAFSRMEKGEPVTIIFHGYRPHPTRPTMQISDYSVGRVPRGATRPPIDVNPKK